MQQSSCVKKVISLARAIRERFKYEQKKQKTKKLGDQMIEQFDLGYCKISQ